MKKLSLSTVLREYTDSWGMTKEHVIFECAGSRRTSSLAQEGYRPSEGQRYYFSALGCPILARCVGILDGFMATSLEITYRGRPCQGQETFLRIKKKIGLMVNIEVKSKLPCPLLATRKKKPSPQEEGSPQEREGKGVETPTSIVVLPKDRKNRGASILSQILPIKQEVPERCLYLR